MNLLKWTKYKLIFSILFISVLLIPQSYVAAATPPLTYPSPIVTNSNSPTSSGSCGSSSLYTDNLIAPQPLIGKIFAKLPSTEMAMTVTLYSQPIFGNNCTLLSSAVVSPNLWTYMGEINDNTPASTIIAQGSNLFGEPYSASLDLLNVPSSNPCVVKGNSCLATFSGYTGVLQPSIISTDTSQIALYVANPIDNSTISSINYYADGSFIYSTKKLLPVNRNYLSGGIHNIQIQVRLAKGETLNINQTINMGTDWTGSLLFKSTFYRSKNKVSYFANIGAIVLLVVLVLGLVRHLYKRHMFKIEHGLSKDKFKNKEPDDKETENKNQDPPMVVG